MRRWYQWKASRPSRARYARDFEAVAEARHEAGREGPCLTRLRDRQIRVVAHQISCPPAGVASRTRERRRRNCNPVGPERSWGYLDSVLHPTRGLLVSLGEEM